MADDIASLVLEIDSDGVVKASGALDRLQTESKQTEKDTKNLKKETKGATAQMAAFAAKIGAAALAYKAFGGIIKTAANMEKLQASLVSVTGSTEGATAAMEQIMSQVSDLPVSIDELTRAYIKLTALGLEPSREALESYTNTASAMGKDLNQMIEAVADAATGEFERLKEFGIKARSEGDRVSFTFQGVTTEIGKNSREIQDYLLDIGNTQFAGAAAKQMDTLEGRASNLGVAIEQLSITLAGETGLAWAAKESLEAMTGLINIINKGLGGGVESTIEQQLKGAKEALADLIEDVDTAVKNERINDLLGGAGTGAMGIAEARLRVVKQIELIEELTRKIKEKNKEERGGDGKAPAESNMEWLLNLYIAEEEALDEHDSKMREMQLRGQEETANLTLQGYIDDEKDLEDHYSAQESATANHRDTMIAAHKGMASSILSITRSFGMENSALAKTAFAAEQGLAAAQTWVAGVARAQAAARNAALLGAPDAGATAYAAVMLQTKLAMASIAAATVTGLSGGGGGSSGGGGPTGSNRGSAPTPQGDETFFNADTGRETARAPIVINQNIMAFDSNSYIEHRDEIFDAAEMAANERGVTLDNG